MSKSKATGKDAGDKSAETVAPSRTVPDRVRFDYLKSSCFRVVHADGAIGGVTPRLDVHMDFWSERFPIPKQVVHCVNEDGTLGDEIREERDSRKAVVREVEVGVVMNYENAKALRDWLDEKIQEVDKIRGDIERRRKGET